jgi:hypothetical protein
MVLPLATVQGKKRTAATLDAHVVVETKKMKQGAPPALVTQSADELRASSSATVVLDILKAYPQAVKYGPDSYYIPRYFNNAEADHLLRLLQEELVYVPRNDARLQFKIFNAVNQLPRDKSFLGDVSGDVAPQYRYNPPGNNQYPDVMPWGPTTELIRQRLAVIQFTCHLVANRYRNGADHIGFQSASMYKTPNAPHFARAAA